LVPRFSKNGLLALVSIFPAVLNVETKPVGSRNGRRFGIMDADAAPATTNNTINARARRTPKHTRLDTNFDFI
jgi:hypothetical protein